MASSSSSSSSDPSSDPSSGPSSDFGKLSNELYQQWEQAMTAWWDQVLESPDVLKATGVNLSTMAQARKKYEAGMDQGLERLHLPTRSDLVRVTRIATLLEERLLQLEDTLLVVKDQMDALERETVQARVEAAETRLELRERLAELQARLDAVEGSTTKAAAPKAAARKRAPRKPRAAAATKTSD